MKGRVVAAGILPALIFSLTVSGSLRNLFSAPVPSKDASSAQGAAASASRSSSIDKAAELAEREMALRAKEERLLALKKEVDEKITKYEQLISEIEAKEKEKEGEKKEAEKREEERKEEEKKEAEKREEERKEEEKKEAERKEEVSGNIDLLVKLFEVMPAEDAATRIEELDEEIAAVILSKMRGRKAGNVLAAMSPKKSAIIVHRIAGIEKNFPAQ